jgi:hypothetical protein
MEVATNFMAQALAVLSPDVLIALKRARSLSLMFMGFLSQENSPSLCRVADTHAILMEFMKFIAS